MHWSGLVWSALGNHIYDEPGQTAPSQVRDVTRLGSHSQTVYTEGENTARLYVHQNLG